MLVYLGKHVVVIWLCFSRKVKLPAGRFNLLEEPPSIARNPSHFAVLAAVRESLLTKWSGYFHTLLDASGDDSDAEEPIPVKKTGLLPKVGTSHLSSIHTIVTLTLLGR